MDDRLGRTETIFHELLATPLSLRDVALEERCDGDTALMAELRSLLAACEAEERLATKMAESSSEDTGEGAAAPGERTLGPYKIDKLLGRGGMGAVYLAHRADGQFQQRVAIKVVDLPLASDLFQERFRQERQILASLNHPYIARLLDGGVSSEGDLYLAMEFVDGISISRFCEEHKLSIRERLLLFQQVCEAVQFAHRNLIVHRDLKPDNILVGADGTPRLLDFGTAKLHAPSMAEDISGLTRNGLQSFTPQYASPEQVLGESITTATDIYSLGVLLYLLLAGVPPYRLEEFTMAEMLRVICNEEPPKPSSVAVLSPGPDADLDAIVLKALRKEPQQRYATVDQLSANVAAYLEGRPVEARRGTMQYRATKFIRRNRVGFVAALLLFLTVIAGIGGVLWQSRSANQQRRRAEARSEDLRQLSNSLLSELDQALKDIPGSTGAQKLLVTRVTEHLDRMAKDAQGDRQTELDLIAAYTRLGDVQGDIYDQSLSDPMGALASYGKALALAQPLAAAHPADKDVLAALAKLAEDRGEVLTGYGSPEDAVASLREGATAYDRLIALAGATPKLILETSTAHQTLGNELAEDEGMGDNAAGIAEYRKSLALDESAHQLDPAYMPARRGLATMHLNIGNGQLDDDPAEALQEFRIGLQKLDMLPGEDKQKLYLVRMRAIFVRKEGVALSGIGEYGEAKPLFAQAGEVFQRLSDADPKEIRSLGDIYRLLVDEIGSSHDEGDPALGAAGEKRLDALHAEEQFLQQEMAILKRMVQLDPKQKAWQWQLDRAVVAAGSLAHELHETVDAKGMKESLTRVTHVASDPHSSLSAVEIAIESLADVTATPLRDSQQAVVFAQRGVEITHRKSAASFLELAQAYRVAGRTADAVAAAQTGLSLLPEHKGAPPSNIRRLLEYELRGS